MGSEELFLFLRLRCCRKQLVDAYLAVFGRFNHEEFSFRSSEGPTDRATALVAMGRSSPPCPTLLCKSHDTDIPDLLFRMAE